MPHTTVPAALRARLALAASALTILAAPANAGAATIHVETDGTDSTTCGSAASACKTVARGITNAVSGDTIAIGEGTFPVATTIQVTTKSLTIEGAGESRTKIDGEHSTSFGNNGTFRFTSHGTRQAIRDLTFVRTGRGPAATARAYGIIAQPQGTGSGVDLLVEHVTFEGSARDENPFTSNNNPGDVLLDDFTSTDVSGNSILLGRHTGSFTIRNSHLETKSTDAGYAYYDYSWGGVAWHVTGSRVIENTTFTSTAGIGILAGFSGLAPAAYLGGATIRGNTFRSPSPTAVGVTVSNGPEVTTANVVAFPDVDIEGNTLVGSGTGDGVRLQGFLDAPQVAENSIRGFAKGIKVEPLGTPLAPVLPRNVAIRRNQLVDNRDGGVPTGVWVGDGVTGTTALDNWWGCNTGPLAATAATDGCDQIVGDRSGVDASRWVVLKLDAAQRTLEPDESSDVSATLARTNTGSTVDGVFAADEDFLLTATGGVVSDPTPPFGPDATATESFRSTTWRGRSVTVVQDHERQVVRWPDIPPTVTVTSPADQLVTTEESVVVEYFATEEVRGGQPTCTPAHGATVPIPEGESTITVTCAYATGEVATGKAQVTRIPQETQGGTTPTPTPTPGPEPAPTPAPTPTTPDLPACAREVMITDVAQVGSSRSRISGRARLKFAGQPALLRFQPSGNRVIARPRIANDGTFSVTVRRPARPAPTSDRARYQVQLGNTTTAWVKLTRRMGSTTVRYESDRGRLRITGRAAPPLVRGARAQVRRSDICGAYRTIGTLRVDSRGRFDGHVSTAPLAPSPVAFIRLSLRVRSSNRSSASVFRTYSIVQPVPILAS